MLVAKLTVSGHLPKPVSAINTLFVTSQTIDVSNAICYCDPNFSHRVQGRQVVYPPNSWRPHSKRYRTRAPKTHHLYVLKLNILYALRKKKNGGEKKEKK
jgi:hypothetical protein